MKYRLLANSSRISTINFITSFLFFEATNDTTMFAGRKTDKLWNYFKKVPKSNKTGYRTI